MSAARTTAVLGLLALALSAPLAAQGLGDTAAREKAKRAAEAKAKKDPAKSFTNQDLDAGRPPGSKPKESTDAPVPSETGTESSGSSAAPEPDRNERERPYLDAITEAQAEVTQAQTRVQALGAKLNPMSTSYIYGSGGSNDANEELRVRDEMRQAERDLEAARQKVVTATQNLQAVRQGRPVSRPE